MPAAAAPPSLPQLGDQPQPRLAATTAAALRPLSLSLAGSTAGVGGRPRRLGLMDAAAAAGHSPLTQARASSAGWP